MDNQNNMRLCGGTFLVLLFEAKGQRRAARRGEGRPSDKKSNPEIFGSLVKFTNPEFIMPEGRTFGTFTSEYKLCRKSDSPSALLTDDEIIKHFDTSFHDFHSQKLQDFNRFLTDAISINAKGTWLVAALLDMIRFDESIAEDTKFYIHENGDSTTKAELLDVDSYCVPAFILGVWHYIITHVLDNSIGADSLDSLLSSPGEKRAERKFDSKIGKETADAIQTYIEIPETSAASIDATTAVTDRAEESKPTKIKISYKGGRLTPEMEQTFLSWNPSVVDLNYEPNAYLLSSNRNAKFILRTICHMNFEMAPDFTLQIKVRFTIDDTEFSGFTSSDNWDSQSYVNNLVSAGDYTCIAWFKVINPNAAKPQVQFYMIGEPDE